jgi:hypothetical protein
MANVSNGVKVSVALLAIAALVVTHLSTSKVHYITSSLAFIVIIIDFPTKNESDDR